MICALFDLALTFDNTFYKLSDNLVKPFTDILRRGFIASVHS